MNSSESNSQPGSQFTLAALFRLTVLVSVGCSLAAATSRWQVSFVLRALVTLAWPSVVILLLWLLPHDFRPIRLLSNLTVALLVSSLMSQEIWGGQPTPLAWGTLLAICWLPQALVIWLIYLDVRDWKKRR